MGPPESVTRPRKTSAAGRQKCRARRPRARRCLLKGCERRVHPRHARQRYCSAECREKARKWSRWKAQQKYRGTTDGKQKRNGQSGRYRERVKSRKPPEPEAVNDSARVITKEHFFRSHVRPAGVLRAIRASAAKSLAAFLFAGVPARAGTGPGARAALETGADLNPDILIASEDSPYIQPVDATGVSSARPALGAFARAPSGAAAAAVDVSGGMRAANAYRRGGCGKPGGPLRSDRWLQADRGAGATGAGHGGSGGVADERGGGRTAGPHAAIERARDRAGSGLAASGIGAAFWLQPGRVGAAVRSQRDMGFAAAGTGGTVAGSDPAAGARGQDCGAGGHEISGACGAAELGGLPAHGGHFGRASLRYARSGPTV